MDNPESSALMEEEKEGVGKSTHAIRTITEVSQDLNVPQHVLRFWETKFRYVRPMKRAGGRRYYRPVDIALLTKIRTLLYDEGYTIKGVQRIIQEQGIRNFLGVEEEPKKTSLMIGAPDLGDAPFPANKTKISKQNGTIATQNPPQPPLNQNLVQEIQTLSGEVKRLLQEIEVLTNP